MDIFAFRQTMDSQTIGNIVVELKRPNVKLGEIEVSQIKTYKNLIFQQPQFNSTSAKWTFILVGNKPDQSGFIKSEKENSVHWGKKDLIQHGNNDGVIYEIYVKTWSSIFDDFEMRYKFLMDRLKFKREELSAKYSNKQDLHDIVNEAQESEGIK
jgi:hypothetical protein